MIYITDGLSISQMRGRESHKRCRRIARMYKSGLYVPAIVGYGNRGYAGSRLKKALERTDQLYYHHPQESTLYGLDDELKVLFRKMYLASNVDFPTKEDDGLYESSGIWDVEWEICKLKSRFEALNWTLEQAADIDKITYEHRPVINAAHYMLQKIVSHEWSFGPMDLYKIHQLLLEITTPCVYSELSKYTTLIEKMRMKT